MKSHEIRVFCHRSLTHGIALAAYKDEGLFVSRLGALLILVLAFVGFVAAPLSHADYRKAACILSAPNGL